MPVVRAARYANTRVMVPRNSRHAPLGGSTMRHNYRSTRRPWGYAGHIGDAGAGIALGAALLLLGIVLGFAVFG